MPKLAIVIPAFKKMYFKETLASIAAQTCKDFTVYIGDDAGHSELGDIVDLFQSQVKIIYKKFNENLGNKDLVAQWERCLDMVADEDWIWLFSDDDLMDRNCVEEFYRTVVDQPSFDLYHFNVNKINDNGIIMDSFIFPDWLSSEDFFYGRSVLGYHSYVVEYIFKKSRFYSVGRFENFDLAWGSDDALWIKLGQDKGIKTIQGAKVYWRSSEHNISPNYRDQTILKRKFTSKIKFIGWIYKQTKENNLNIEESQILKLIEKSFFKELRIYCENLPYKNIHQTISEFEKAFPKLRHIKLKFSYFYFYKFYRYLVRIYNLFLLSMGRHSTECKKN